MYIQLTWERYILKQRRLGFIYSFETIYEVHFPDVVFICKIVSFKTLFSLLSLRIRVHTAS